MKSSIFSVLGDCTVAGVSANAGGGGISNIAGQNCPFRRPAEL